MKHSSAQRFAAGLFVLSTLGALLLILAPRVAAQGLQGPTFADSVLVKEIVFQGDSLHDKETLLAQIATKESPGAFARFLYSIGSWVPLSGEAQYFDVQVFQEDRDALKLYFGNEGFRDATVEGTYANVAGTKAVTTLFRIHLGARSMIDSIDYRNLKRLPRAVDSLIRSVSDRVLVVGRPYSADNVEAEIKRVLRLLGNNGFPNALCDSILVERKLSNKNVTVHLSFTHGQQLIVGPIGRAVKNDASAGDTTRKEGSFNLAQKIIDDRLDLKTGEVYSADARDRSVTNLSRLNIFSSVQIETDIPPLADSTRRIVPVTVLLSMKKRHELAPGVFLNNYNNRLNAGAEISYLFRNAFGGAQSLSSSLTLLSKVDYPISSYNATAQVQLDQPYLFDKSTSGAWTIAFVRAVEAGIYGGSILQNVVDVKRQFSERVQGVLSWTLEQSQYEIIAKGQSLVNTPFARFDTTGIDYRNSILTLTVDRDYTNDFFYPTSGLSLRGTIEEAGLLKQALPGLFRGFRSAEYRKLEGTLRYFHDLSRNKTTIFGVKLKAGGIFRYGESKADNIPVPFNRRYYAGGSQSIRAWSARALSAGGEAQAAFGGNALVETSAELRWQMFPNARNLWSFEPSLLWLVTFVDAGNLWSEPYKIRVNETAVAMGVGIRYNLFFGPFRIDYGMKAFDPGASERPWFFQRPFLSSVLAKGHIVFGIGHAF